MYMSSLLALAIVIERAIRMRRSALIDPAVIEEIQKLLEIEIRKWPSPTAAKAAATEEPARY